MMLRKFRADLHVHTCLSPCGDMEMLPRAIVRVCLQREIDIIAICDHNSAENVKYVINAAEGTNLTVLAGIEVTTEEEVHMLAVFDDEEQVLTLQKEVYKYLLPGENDENLFGLQVVVNTSDEVEKIVNKLLIGGTTLPLNYLVERIHCLGGLAIASHIDRESFSLVGQLGMIPDDLGVDALEVSQLGKVDKVRDQVVGAERFPLITSSDAHRLDQIGRVWTWFFLEEATVEEIRKSFRKVEGRKIVEGGFSP